MPQGWVINNYEWKGYETIKLEKGNFTVFIEFHPKNFGSLGHPKIISIPSECDGLSAELSGLKKRTGIIYRDGLTLRQLVGLDGQPNNGRQRLPSQPMIPPVVRGKEMATAVGDIILIHHFGTHGHLAPDFRQNYDRLGETIEIGTKGYSYKLPEEFQGNNLVANNEKRHIRVTCSLVGQNRVLNYVDHRGFMKTRVGRLNRPVTAEDLTPGSKLWKHLWSENHGPDWYLEKDLAIESFDRWVLARREEDSRKPILDELCENQLVFNGLGPWMAHDLLSISHIHPIQPARSVARNCELAEALKANAIAMFSHYRPARESPKARWVTIYMAKDGPYAFNESAHNSWRSAVRVYKRLTVTMTEAEMKKVPKGHLHLAYQLKDDGSAEWPGEGEAPPPTRYKHGLVPVMRYECGASVYYTHIQARPSGDWTPYDRVTAVPEEEDVFGPANLNKPTLGPYAFELYVKGRISNERKPKKGRPYKLTTGGIGTSKSRPGFCAISRHALPNKRVKDALQSHVEALNKESLAKRGNDEDENRSEAGDSQESPKVLSKRRRTDTH